MTDRDRLDTYVAEAGAYGTSLVRRLQLQVVWGTVLAVGVVVFGLTRGASPLRMAFGLIPLGAMGLFIWFAFGMATRLMLFEPEGRLELHRSLPTASLNADEVVSIRPSRLLLLGTVMELRSSRGAFLFPRDMTGLPELLRVLRDRHPHIDVPIDL